MHQFLPCEENRETDATNQQALEGVFVIEHSSWIPDDVGLVLQYLLCWCCWPDVTQVKRKTIMPFFFLILINVIPSSVCPHVCSIHLHVYYLIFTLFIEAIT